MFERLSHRLREMFERLSYRLREMFLDKSMYGLFINIIKNSHQSSQQVLAGVFLFLRDVKIRTRSSRYGIDSPVRRLDFVLHWEVDPIPT